MNQTLLDIRIIVVLILASGVFVAAEMSLVSLRDSQVRQLAHRSKRGRTVAKLNDNPNRFLSTVQIGVTLFGFLSAAFGGATAGRQARAGAGQRRSAGRRRSRRRSR